MKSFLPDDRQALNFKKGNYLKKKKTAFLMEAAF